MFQWLFGKKTNAMGASPSITLANDTFNMIMKQNAEKKFPYELGTKKPLIGLKVKILEMAGESKIISKQKSKYLRNARILNIRLKLQDDKKYTPEQKARILKNAMKSLDASEQRFKSNAFKESDSAKALANFKTYEDLHEHQVQVVRPEIRAAGLAYGFHKGIPYWSMETTRRAGNFPNWLRVEYHILKFSADKDQRLVQQQYAQWLDEARK